MMASEEGNSTCEDTKIFSCSICALKEKYDYKGTRPPFSKQICTIDDCYIAKDPFSPTNKNEILVLGSDCSICNRAVCVSSSCSIFFKNTVCRHCALQNINMYPERLKKTIALVFK